METGINGRVLVVDDEEGLRVVVGSMLARLGYSAVTAVNGREAVEYYREHGDGIVLVLLDIMMPVMNGVECCRELRQLDPEAKIILITGHAPNGMVQKMREVGAQGILYKPFGAATLAEEMQRVLG